eukprot:scaffold67254_cov14-Tisochrysis_lutea.AAC.1
MRPSVFGRGANACSNAHGAGKCRSTTFCGAGFALENALKYFEILHAIPCVQSAYICIHMRVLLRTSNNSVTEQVSWQVQRHETRSDAMRPAWQ